jgi:hypothetical protein
MVDIEDNFRKKRAVGASRPRPFVSDLLGELSLAEYPPMTRMAISIFT